MNDNEIEKEMANKGLYAPKVTQEMISEVIVRGKTQYYAFPHTQVTICCITLRNGFNVIGESACASPENFDEELGKKIAYDNARDKIWQLEGYLLKQSLCLMETNRAG